MKHQRACPVDTVRLWGITLVKSNARAWENFPSTRVLAFRTLFHQQGGLHLYGKRFRLPSKLANTFLLFTFVPETPCAGSLSDFAIALPISEKYFCGERTRCFTRSASISKPSFSLVALGIEKLGRFLGGRKFWFTLGRYIYLSQSFRLFTIFAKLFINRCVVKYNGHG